MILASLTNRAGKRRVIDMTVPVIAVISVSLIMALRYDVGTDWENYKDIFDSYSITYNIRMQDTLSNDRIEPLYSLLNHIVARSGGSYQLFLFIIMALHLTMLMAICRSFPRYSTLIVFFYFTVLFLSTLNIHRQTLAICIFLFALNFLAKKQNLKYYLYSALACLTHVSSIIILFVPILKSKIFRFLDNRYISLGLYIAGFFIGQFLMDMIITYIPLLTDNAKYNTTIANLEHVHEYSSGLGLLFYEALDILLIMNFPKFTAQGLAIYTRTFLAGSVISNAFANSMFLARVALPFTSIKIILAAILLTNFLKDRKLTVRKSAALIIILFAFIGFMMNIANHNSGCSPFQFI